MDRGSLDIDAGAVVRVPTAGVVLEGNLGSPAGAEGVVLFAHGSGSSRFSPRNRLVAQTLQGEGLATLLIDLLTSPEEAVDMRTRHLRFDIDLLADRLAGVTDWLLQDLRTHGLRIGYFGSSTGAAAALVAAARRPKVVDAIVSRGGRPDLAGEALVEVKAPTLLIVGSRDYAVIQLNQQALQRLQVDKRLDIVAGASHLFEEPGTLEEVARLACDWFQHYLSSRRE